ncbi:MAG: hypothetical protein ABIF82_03550 [Planctomycetota bacterium]
MAELDNPGARCRRLMRDMDILAFRLARDPSAKDDLKQEMACHLLTLPPGQTRAWYLSRVGDHAKKHVGRCLIDAPLGPRGRPILERQTVAVGGLRELDHIHRRQRVA